MTEDRRSFQARSTESLQENLSSGEPAIFAGYGLIGAILLFGGIGFAIDRWLGTSPWFLLAGLLAGLAIGFYGLARAIRH